MKSKRHVLFLQSSSEGYGSGKIILQVLRFYQQEGLAPVVVLTNEGPLQGELEKLQIPVYIQNLGILRRKYVSPTGILNRLNKNLKAYRFLSQLHARCSFDLVYSNTLAVIIGAYWAKRNQLPHIWHIHEILPGPAPLVKLLSKMLDSSTPKPIAVSQAVANHWQPFLKKSQIQVIHNGIPYQEFLEAKPTLRNELGISDDQLLIGMVGRINPGKGQKYFVQLAEALLKKHSNLEFVLAGDPFPGYEFILEEVLVEIKRMKLESKVHYIGFREDIPEIMASLDIFILPSQAPDSFPTVILESMASGTPVVATQSGGAEEMVLEGETGFLIPQANLDAGIIALEKLIMNPALREKMSEAGRKRVLTTYSLDAFEHKITQHLWLHLKKD